MPGSCGWFPLPYDEILAWVQFHAEELPQTLDELSAFPIAFRRVIVNFVSPERRTRFWEDHLRTFLGPHSSLNAEQRAFVEDTISQFPEIFAGQRGEGQTKMRALE